MRKILGEAFFSKPTVMVAEELLGKYLVRQRGGKTESFIITETEAYAGRDDMSSHAACGMTRRNHVMFGHPGRWYVYFIYGIHHCLNAVTESNGTPAAVLIRGLQGISGPGRVCRKLGITKAFYGKPAARSSGLWVEDRGVLPASRGLKIRKTPRVNVGGDAQAKRRRWRFVLT